MAFKLAGSLEPWGGPLLRSEIIFNSLTVTELDSVHAASGFISTAVVASLVFGHVVGLVQNLGIGLNTTGAAGAAIGSFVNAFTVASDNQTNGKVRAQCDISKKTLYSVASDGTIGTTTGSNLLGFFTNVSSSGQSTSTGETSTLSSTLQYHIWGTDPNKTANQIVNVYQSQPLGV